MSTENTAVTKNDIANEALLPGNVCFGCGFSNPYGMHPEFRRDGDRTDRLVGVFDPPPHSVGFPGLTHGAVIYAVLDCISCWTPTVLRPDTKAVWILRSASVKYHQASPAGQRLHLSGTIVQEGAQWEAMLVQSEARTTAGDLIVDGQFKLIPLSASRFMEVAKISSLPENWRKLLAVS
jgi:hypothetical protein